MQPNAEEETRARAGDDAQGHLPLLTVESQRETKAARDERLLRQAQARVQEYRRRRGPPDPPQALADAAGGP